MKYIAVPRGTPAPSGFEPWAWGLEPRFNFTPASSSLRQVSVRVGRIELPIEPYQGPVIPFNYTRMVDEQVIEQRNGLATPARPP